MPRRKICKKSEKVCWRTKVGTLVQMSEEFVGWVIALCWAVMPEDKK